MPDQHATTTAPTDEELFLRYRNQGDHDAFAQLVHRYEKELFGYLRRYLGRGDLAEEVFQATFIRVHRKRDAFEEGRALRPWLYSIATHLAIDALRRAKRRPALSLERPSSVDQAGAEGLRGLLESEAPSPLIRAENEEQQEWVRNAVAHLPEHLRSVILLVFFQGMKYEEAAEALEIPVGTLKSRIHSAVKRLTAAWNRAQPPEDVRAADRPSRRGSVQLTDQTPSEPDPSPRAAPRGIPPEDIEPPPDLARRTCEQFHAPS